MAQESTEKWLQKLLSEGKDACLLGQIVLGEILACPSAKQIGKINFCLLDVNDFERIQRLKKSNTDGTDQNMLNWSSWLRMHSRDPQWTPHVIQEDAADIMDFTQLSPLKSYEEVANVKILDTTDLALHEVAGKMQQLWFIFYVGKHYNIESCMLSGTGGQKQTSKLGTGTQRLLYEVLMTKTKQERSRVR